MRVELRLDAQVSIGGEAIMLGQTLALLEGIARERSLAGAAGRLGLSYRTAWGRLLSFEKALGQPLVVKTKGHGSVLTAFGAEVRDTLGATLARFAAPLAEEQRALESRLSALLSAPQPKLRIAASNDPLLTRCLAQNPAFDLRVTGSAEAVARLLAGEADLAGFHTGGGMKDADPARQPPFDRLLGAPDAFRVRPLFQREQGLLLAPSNPLGIRSVGDIAAKKARFVNRQPGSGTRLWFDGLLRQAGLGPGDIDGYDVEEFTHQAVAAVVASGAADVGMGVRAAAERFGLAFESLGRETYYLAHPASLEDEPPIVTLFTTMSEEAARAVGYEHVAV